MVQKSDNNSRIESLMSDEREEKRKKEERERKKELRGCDGSGKLGW